MAFTYIPRAKIDDSLLLTIIQGHSWNKKLLSLNVILHRGVGWMHVCMSRKWYEVKENLQVGIVVFQAGHRNHLHDAPSSIYPSKQHNNDRFTKLDSPVDKEILRLKMLRRNEGGGRSCSEKSLKARRIGIWARQQRKKREMNKWNISSRRRERMDGWMDGWMLSSPSIISTSLPNFHPLKRSDT